VKQNNIIRDKSLEFAIEIVTLYKKLKEVREYTFADQILRSGASIAANVEEATAAISKRDFIAKMSISSKEARETRLWLAILEKGAIIDHDLTPYFKLVDELINILTAIVKTAQANLNEVK